MTGKTEGRIIRITGIVQGVGFRPFVYRLAESLFLKGFIRNTSMGVHIQVEGYVEALASFARRLKDEAPPLAHIDEMLEEVCKTEGFEDFVIQESEVPGGEATGISPDISTCADCREEFSDSACFRYHYPFINCTNCGPRFSIIKDIPYDRENTTMAPFQMCRKCAAQYSEPKDRRYHAQPVACEECGPTLFAFKSPAAPCGFAAAETADIQEFKAPVVVEGNDEAAGLAAEVIAAGGIAAVKGIGGYHLACNAANKAAILELRKRKSREEKPFALMASDIKTISKYC
ncbi:MAG: carbamoyltransferase HypF, partial [Clostridiales bacterium]|nr:carbamoyltransferase HypF [Clostridiales bacterium]